MRSLMAARQSLLAGRRALTRQPLAVTGLLQRRLSTEASSEAAAAAVEARGLKATEGRAAARAAATWAAAT